MYFKDFPKFLYDFKYGNTDETQTSIVLDTTRNVRFRKEVLSNYTLYDEYDIVDGETPEIIAEKVYGNPNYHWIIMLANDRYDWVSDFPLDYPALIKHTADKYNPLLKSTAGNWYIKEGKLWFRVTNVNYSFDERELLASVVFTVKGSTTAGAFSITKTWNQGGSGFNSPTQEFWVETNLTTAPVGDLTITTTNREQNPAYWVNAAGYKVDPSHPEAESISGLQKEELDNEKKRRIKIISPEVISVILKQYKEFL